MAEERSETVVELIDERVAVYGDPTETFVRIAQVWTGILGFEVQPWAVPLCMAGMKFVRTTQAPDYSDNSDDVDGYMDIFRQIIGEDMVKARSVTEYIELKKIRDGAWVDSVYIEPTAPCYNGGKHPAFIGLPRACPVCGYELVKR